MNTKMLTLAVDVGNTRTKAGVCAAGEPLPEVRKFAEIANKRPTDVLPKLAELLDKNPCTTAVISGSNGTLRDRVVGSWDQLSGSAPKLLVVRTWTQLDLEIDVETPETTGIDRLITAHGAMQLWPEDAVILIDAGTATTVDLVSNNQFRGGAILPGLELSAKALNQHTDALPLIETRFLTPDAVHPVGRSTIEAIQAGLVFGHVGAVRELVGSIRKQHPHAKLLLTGGAASQLGGSLPDAMIDLTFGLRALANLVSADH